MRFHFPTALIRPEFEEPAITVGRITVTRRLWETTTFDLTTLATRHKLYISWQMIDAFLTRCNVEMSLEAADFADAQSLLFAFRVMLYAAGCSPFAIPLASSHSINQYSGINSRDSDTLRDGLPEGLREGITSDTATVEVWPVELSLQLALLPDQLGLSRAQIEQAARALDTWLELRGSTRALDVFEGALTAAPQITSFGQSLLHVWCGLEALFPSVQTEVAFRVALYLALVEQDTSQRLARFHDAKKAYGIRSAVAHGSKPDLTYDEWRRTWNIAMSTLRAVIARGALPTEDVLVREVFGGTRQ